MALKKSIESMAGSIITAFDLRAAETSLPRWELAKEDLSRLRSWWESYMSRYHGKHSARLDVHRFEDREALDSYDEIVGLLTETAATNPRLAQEVCRLSEQYLTSIRLPYQVVEANHWTQSQHAPAPPAKVQPFHVVIPFRDDTQSQSRLSTLLTTLGRISRIRTNGAALNVTVVESSSQKRNESIIHRFGFNYLHHPYGGPFSRSAAINTGVYATAENTEIIVIMDADAIVPLNFAEIIGSARLHERNFVPAMSTLCLDITSTTRLASALETSAQLEGRLSGFSLHMMRGICIVVRRTDFMTVGGFDEGYRGWGGEDVDFHSRLNSKFGVGRLPGMLLHLHHERPDMTDFTKLVMAGL